jgi:ABC-type transporter Mla subunit MlaD
MDELITMLQGHRDKLRKISENASQLNALVKTFSEVVNDNREEE